MKVVALAALLQVASPALSTSDTEAETLRQTAKPYDLDIGTAIRSVRLGEQQYADRAAAEFNSVTPENELKWADIEPVRGKYAFGPADRIVDFAVANTQKVRGHTLTWHSALPAWLTSGDFTQAELRAILKAHIETLMTRYQGRISAWDVVNEPMAEAGGLRENSFWFQRLGPGYIADAFRWARAADPTAKLYLNEYGAEVDGVKARSLYDQVKSLLAQGVPIDGIGFQTHQMNTSGTKALGVVMRRFADLGLEVAITELDIRIFTTSSDPGGELARQAEVYRKAVQECRWAGCKSITVWGFTDKYSWIPGYCQNNNCVGWGDATVHDKTYQKKPAYEALAGALRWQRNPADPIAWWRLDDWSGTTATDFSGNGHRAEAVGAGALATQERQPGKFAFTGNGTNTELKTTSAVVVTDRSYTVSAWVRLSTGAHTQVIASQDGASTAAFTVGYDAGDGKWFFTIPSTDSPGAVAQTVKPPGTAALNVWTHLTAVWNLGWGRLVIYVNGTLQAAIPRGSDPAHAVSWPSTGRLRIGHGATGGHLAGNISDVRVYARALDDQEIKQVADPAVGRWTFNGHTGDESWFIRDGFPRPQDDLGWTTGTATTQALSLSGNRLIDVRRHPPLYTHRSYSVAAWVKLGTTTTDRVIVSQDGTKRHSFALWYQKADNKWAYTIPAEDSGTNPNMQTVKSSGTASPGQWTHLTAVWNAETGRMKLHVNVAGQPPQITEQPAVSWASSPTGALHIGVSIFTGGHWIGAIREVRVYQKALSDAEVTAIATSG